MEDNKYTDLKILLGFISSVIGVVSHFYPIPFPLNQVLLACCIAGYAVCAGLYYLIENKCERDAFFICKAHHVNKTL